MIGKIPVSSFPLSLSPRRRGKGIQVPSIGVFLDALLRGHDKELVDRFKALIITGEKLTLPGGLLYFLSVIIFLLPSSQRQKKLSFTLRSLRLERSGR